jgi:hypothetical protein
MKSPGDPPPQAPHMIVPWNVPQPGVAAAVPAPAPSPSPSPSAPPRYGVVPGAKVLVQWADGNRYPGTVMQVAGTQLLVAFPNGQQHWIDARYVSPAA